MILHLNGMIQKPGDGDFLAEALPGLVDGVGEYFKNGMLAAVDTV